ncbi:MAG: glycosyltransferase family 2 protein [Bryobacterales bacterium]|nr:glycosyltransferase family 2 protein [Bryobacterales bacterium]
MDPLVSILIPSFNAEKWIGDCLRSALSQTWKETEVIVVDDGSTDRTVEVAKSFEPDGVRVYRQDNRGAASARNEAYRHSQGQYIQWLDADDLLSPVKIERQMAVRGSATQLLSGPWGYFLYRPANAEFIPNELWADLGPAEWLLRKLQFNAHMQTGTWLVSRELTEAAGPWDPELIVDDDGEYFCRVLRCSTGVKFVDGAKVYYRNTGASSVSYIGHSAKKCAVQWRSMKLHVHHLLSMEDSECARRACGQYLQNWLIHFYPEQPDIVEEVHALAGELGQALAVPDLSWKYSWIRGLLGWSAAKRAQSGSRLLRWSAQRMIDRVLSHTDRVAGVRPVWELR